MLAHGAFLRWPPWLAAGLGEANQPEECAISLFHTNRATTPRLLVKRPQVAVFVAVWRATLREGRPGQHRKAAKITSSTAPDRRTPDFILRGVRLLEPMMTQQ
jgi:hypothetical protein